jgi:tRNA dimethylallyltransferase
MNLENKVPRIVLAGPTGIGKTSASLELVRQLRASGRPASIISADSRQCYRFLDIGTGKVTPDEAGDIRHYNISILTPDQPDSAAAFVKRASEWEIEIRSRNEIPIYVGGSTLHLQSLIWPLDDIPGSCVYNQIKLAEIEKEHGQEYILEMLQKSDPDYLLRVEGYNRSRIFRALDVFMQTGNPFSSYHSEQNLHEIPSNTLLFVLTAERDWHVQHINNRVDKMIEFGLTNETSSVLKLGYSIEAQALQTVGYKEVIDYLDGKFDLSHMTNLIKTSTRQYAKRQATWFRRWKTAQTIDVTCQTSHYVVLQIMQNINAF